MGHIHNGKQRYACTDCGRQFVEFPNNIIISDETKALIDKLLLERLSLRAIVRITGVSLKWLQKYVNDKYENIPHEINVTPKDKRRLTIECDELWSFVFDNKQWVWLAIDRDTREIVGMYIGSRDIYGAQGLWDSLPPVYRQCAVSFTDFWEAYKSVFPSKRHKASSKKETVHIERLNNTLRQRIARLVRKTLSFSKKLENHIGAIWYFTHHYNLCLS